MPSATPLWGSYHPALSLSAPRPEILKGRDAYLCSLPSTKPAGAAGGGVSAEGPLALALERIHITLPFNKSSLGTQQGPGRPNF